MPCRATCLGQNITLANGRNAYGQEVQAGIQTVLDDLNRQGGVHGRRVVLRTLDDDNQGDKAEGNARRLIDEGVFMVFAQVVPNPWSGKTALARQYRGAFARAFPGKEVSYGSLEGYATARALVAALERAGPQPTRAGFVNALEAGSEIDLGGMRLSYRPGGHRGSSFVDLSMVNREGRFLQ